MTSHFVTEGGNSTLDKIVNFAIPPNIVGFLNTTLYRNQLMLINYWSFIHFISGLVYYKYISKDFKLWVWIHILFEITEYLLGYGTGNPLFVEEGVDIAMDITLSLLGFKVAQKLFRK